MFRQYEADWLVPPPGGAHFPLLHSLHARFTKRADSETLLLQNEGRSPMSGWQYVTLATLAVTLLVKLTGIIAGVAFAVAPSIFNLPPEFQGITGLTWQSALLGAIGAGIVYIAADILLGAQQWAANSAAERQLNRIRYVASEIERVLGTKAAETYLDQKMSEELDQPPSNLLSRMLFR